MGLWMVVESSQIKISKQTNGVRHDHTMFTLVTSMKGNETPKPIPFAQHPNACHPFRTFLSDQYQYRCTKMLRWPGKRRGESLLPSWIVIAMTKSRHYKIEVFWNLVTVTAGMVCFQYNTHRRWMRVSIHWMPHWTFITKKSLKRHRKLPFCTGTDTK